MSSQTTAGGAITSPAARPNKRPLLRQVSRFFVIGGCSAATDFACYTLLLGSFGLSIATAKGISYVTGMVVGFFGNKLWTFQSRRRAVSEPLLYMAWYFVTLAVNMATNGLVLELLGPQATLPAFLAATGLTTVLNFLGLRLIAFRRALIESEIINSSGATIGSPGMPTFNAAIAVHSSPSNQ